MLFFPEAPVLSSLNTKWAKITWQMVSLLALAEAPWLLLLPSVLWISNTAVLILLQVWLFIFSSFIVNEALLKQKTPSLIVCLLRHDGKGSPTLSKAVTLFKEFFYHYFLIRKSWCREEAMFEMRIETKARSLLSKSQSHNHLNQTKEKMMRFICLW